MMVLLLGFVLASGAYCALRGYYQGMSDERCRYRWIMLCIFMMLMGYLLALTGANHLGLISMFNEGLKGAAISILKQDRQQMLELFQEYKKSLNITSYVMTTFSIGFAVMSFASQKQAKDRNPYTFGEGFDVVTFVSCLLFSVTSVVYFQIVKYGAAMCFALVVLASTCVALSAYFYLLQTSHQIEHNMANKLLSKMKTLIGLRDNRFKEAIISLGTLQVNGNIQCNEKEEVLQNDKLSIEKLKGVIDEVILWQRCLIEEIEVDISLQAIHHYNAFMIFYKKCEIRQMNIKDREKLKFLFGYYSLYPSLEKNEDLHGGYFRAMIQAVLNNQCEPHNSKAQSVDREFISGMMLARIQQMIDRVIVKANGSVSLIPPEMDQCICELWNDCKTYLGNDWTENQNKYLSNRFCFCVAVHLLQFFDVAQTNTIMKNNFNSQIKSVEMKGITDNELKVLIERIVDLMKYNMWKSPNAQNNIIHILGGIKDLFEDNAGEVSNGRGGVDYELKN